MAAARLSTGTHHLDVSRDLIKNLEQRQAIIALARNDPIIQRRLVQWCKDDLIFYANLFVFAFDPSKKGIDAALPWITFPFQEDAALARPDTHAHLRPFDRGILWCYENDKTMACEKSRWQGASWWFLIIQNWLCGFHPYVQTMNVSRNEDAVDDGTRNSLFWKLRYIQDRQPDWLMGEIPTTKLYFHFNRTDSEITGEASTAKAGVGGRASVLFVDEYPEIERAQEVREKTALTTNCRFFNGTHLGVGTPFQKMCDPEQSPEIVRIRMHWTQHPEQSRGMYEYDPIHPTKPILRDPTYVYPDDFKFILDGNPTGGPRPGVRSPWYDAKDAEMGDRRATAMNLDISPEGAAKQFFDAMKIRSAMASMCQPPVWVGDVRYDHKGTFLGLVEGPQGRLRLWVRPKADGTLPAARYTAGADVSAGTGATNSCFAGIDGDRSSKVLEWMDPYTVETEFAQISVALCRLMADEDGNPAHFGWDSSGQQGTKFEKAVIDLGYRHIYYNESEVTRMGVGPKTVRPGWYGSNTQRYSLLVDYRQALYDRLLTDRSESCLRETLLFEYDRTTKTVKHAKETRSNDPSGARENHGDMVIATGIGWMLAKDMAEGGKKSFSRNENPQMGTLDWLLALDGGRGRRFEESYV